MRQPPFRSWSEQTGRLVVAGLLLVVVVAAAVSPLLTRGKPAAVAVTPAPSIPTASLALPAPPTVPPTAAPVYAVYREAIVGRPMSLNPILASTDAERDLASLLFAGLTRSDEHGAIQGDLAERWTTTDDGKSITFELRQDARWHDGRPVTADDVLFTVRLMQDPDFPGSRTLTALWRTVQLEVLSEHSVRFTLSEPYAPFLAQTGFPILPAHRLRNVFPGDLFDHEFSRQPVGAGPFKVGRSWAENDISLVLERHDVYHGGRPAIEQVVIQFYPTLDEALQDLEVGQVDGIGGVPSERLGEVRGDQSLRVETAPLTGYMTMLFNLRRPLFQQREVRQALTLAVDRVALVDEALAGAAIPGTGPIVHSSWAYEPAAPTGSVHEARALLERGGWFVRGEDGIRERDGKRLSFTLLTTDSGERPDVAKVLARQLRAIGVQVSVAAVPSVDLVPRYLASHDFDAALFGWITLGEEPDPYVQWHSSQAERGYNFAGWSLPRADELLETARLTVDRTTRRDRYREFQQLFATEAPSIVLYYPQYHYVTTKRLHGVDLGPISRPADRFRSIHMWRIEAAQAVG